MESRYSRYWYWLITICFLSEAIVAQTSAEFLQKARDIFRSSPDSAVYYADKALQFSGLSDSMRLEINLIKAESYRQRGDLDGFRNTLTTCQQLNHKVHHPKAALTISNLSGLYHWKLTNFDSAIYYFLDVRERALLLNDTIGIIKSYNNLGIIYSDIGEDAKSLSHYNKGVEFAIAARDSIGLIFLYTGLSNYYREQKEYDKAIDFIDRTLSISTQRNSLVEVQRALTNRGATYYRMKEYALAESSLLKGLEIAEEKYLAESLVKIYYHLGEVYIATRNYDKAESCGQKVLNIALKENFAEDVKYGHEMLYLVAKARGDYEEALHRHEMYMTVKDSIFNVENMANISEIETRYKTAQKDIQLLKLASDMEIMDRNKRLFRTRLLFVGLALFLLAIAYFLQRSRKDMQREKRQREAYTAGILRSREEERKLLSKDLHDHIGQNLVLLNQSLQRGDLTSSKELTQGVLEDIRRVSRELYPWQIEKLGLRGALIDLIRTAEKNTDILLTYEIDITDDIVDREKALQIYRILQECINNLIKHSKAVSARISLLKKDDRLMLTVQDNGAGFDYKMQLAGNKSLGLMTLRDRIQTLRGRLDVESDAGRGSKFSFSFPLTS